MERMALDSELRVRLALVVAAPKVDRVLVALGLDDLDAAVERAIRAAYDAFPQYQGKRGTDSWRPKTYEECYGRAPLESDDAAEMRVALLAALRCSATDEAELTDEQLEAMKTREEMPGVLPPPRSVAPKGKAKYLCIAAVWVEGSDADDAADQVNDRLGEGLRADGTVGKVVTFEKRETFRGGFVIDLERFDLGDVVTGIEDDAE